MPVCFYMGSFMNFLNFYRRFLLRNKSPVTEAWSESTIKTLKQYVKFAPSHISLGIAIPHF